MQPLWAPVDVRERLGLLDATRAAALLGIFIVNLEWFNRPWEAFGTGAAPGLAGADAALAWAVQVFVAGKAWVLFSLLFGIGFALMQARAERVGRDFAAAYRRRAWTLLAIGLAHGVLLWPGDVLRSYALAALLMLLLRDWPPRRQRNLGLALYLGIAGLSVLLTGLALAVDGGRGMLHEPAAAAASERVYAAGGYLQVTAQRARDLSRLIAGDIAVVPMALGVFLVGSWLLRSGRIAEPGRHRAYHLRTACWALPLGLACSAAIALAFGTGAAQAGGEGRWLFAVSLQQFVALPAALGILSALVLLWLRPAGARALSAIAPAGRMALTHYLLQSLLASTLFYGYGFALWGRLGPAALLALALATFVLQVLASRWWLARYRFGPVEWLWRWATYGRRPPMRLGAAA